MGVLYHSDDEFALGINYTSSVYAPLEGGTDVRLGLFGLRDHFDSSFTFPGKLDLGVAWKPTLNKNFLVCADFNFYGYSKTPNNMTLSFHDLPLKKSNVLGWKDNFSAHAGVSYRLTDRFTVRGGAGYLSQAIPEETVSTLTIDVPGWDVAMGCSYEISRSVTLDISVTRGWGECKVEQGLMKGKYTADIYTFALAGNVSF